MSQVLAGLSRTRAAVLGMARRLRRLHAELRPRSAAAAPQLELADDAHSGEQLSRGLTTSQVAHYKEFGFVVSSPRQLGCTAAGS